MSVRSGADVAAAARAAGFAGEPLATIVAIGRRESGWNDTAQGDLGITDGTWGPSVGVWQIRTLHRELDTGGDRDLHALIPYAIEGRPDSGTGDLARQASAAWSISSAGINFGPWSTAAGISDADMAAAREVIAAGGGSVGPSPALTGGAIQTGVIGDVSGTLVELMDDSLGQVVGTDGPFSSWVMEHVIRFLELAGGAVVFAVGLMMFLDVIGVRHPGTGGGSGLVSRSVRGGRRLVKAAAVAAAA